MKTVLIIAIAIATLITARYYFSSSEGKSEGSDIVGGVGGDDRDSESRPIDQ
jgi:hypothetical protein